MREEHKGGDLLLVIDMQKVYLKGGAWECLDTEVAAANIIKVIDSGVCDRVVLTKFIEPSDPRGVWKDYNEKYAEINADPVNAELIDELVPYAGRFPVYEKSFYSAFADPVLAEVCRSADRLIICGVVAECCVLATVMGAMDAGVKVIYLTDAVSGFTPQKEQAVLTVMSGEIPLHIETMSTDEYISSGGLKKQS